MEACFTNKKISQELYLQPDVVALAKTFLGKFLFTNIDNEITAGIITETEAYNGIVDKASHAYNNRRTNRTQVMYQEGGRAYVYLCYGMYPMFNIVTNVSDIPHAILVRGIFPYKGESIMLKRRKKQQIDIHFSDGPGKVAMALGITCKHTGISLQDNTIWIEESSIQIPDKNIKVTPRIGINYAQEDALLPYRFYIENQYTNILLKNII